MAARILGAALTIAAVGSCLAIAGLDEDYVDGEPWGTGGNPVASSSQGGAAPPSAGGMGGGTSSHAGGAAQGGGGAAGGAAPTAQVLCVGDQLCAPGEVCCLDDNTNAKLMCAASAQGCATGSFAVTCDGAEDCTGEEVCCGTWTGSSWSQIACAPGCGDASEHRVICGGQTPPPGYCSGSCAESGSLPGYYWCDP